jgi:hypothetical protein
MSTSMCRKEAAPEFMQLDEMCVPFRMNKHADWPMTMTVGKVWLWARFIRRLGR